MTLEEARRILQLMYRGAPMSEQVVNINLVAIKYADQIGHPSLSAVVKEAGVPPFYKHENSEGRKLAKYV